MTYEERRKQKTDIDFNNRMDNLIVLNPTIVAYIKAKFVEADVRLTKLFATQSSLPEPAHISHPGESEYYLEYFEVKTQLEALNIFSKSFVERIHSDFYQLVHSCYRLSNPS